VNKNIFTMSFRERRKYRIDELPRDLHEAARDARKRTTSSATLSGRHIYERFLEAKREECRSTSRQVSEWS